MCAGVLLCRDFSTEVDIALRKWAEDEGRLAQLCTTAAQESVLEVLRSKIEVRGGAQGRGGGTVPVQTHESVCVWSTNNCSPCPPPLVLMTPPPAHLL